MKPSTLKMKCTMTNHRSHLIRVNANILPLLNFLPGTVSLSMFCVNCRSLEAHWDTLQELFLTMSSNGLTLAFIGLTEIFKIQDVLHYKINGYHNLLFNTRLDADDGHGGVGLYISETFTYSKREDLSIFIPHVFESIFFELQAAKRKPIIVGVIYRPNSHPRADLDFFTRTVLYIQDKISSENKIAYLMGDFNINLLNVATHQKTNDFIDNVIAQGLIPYITKPTRITSTTATFIDHLYSNHTHTEYDSGIIITDMTDHFGIFHLIYGIPTVRNIKYKQTRQLNEYNILKFRNLLAKADYTSVLSAIDPNEAYNNFMQIYKSLFEISCPVKTTKINKKIIKREPWITSGLLVSSINKEKTTPKKVT